MKTAILLFFVLIGAVSVPSNVTASDAPHTRLTGIWAYADNVTDSLNLDYKQNNLRFFCSTVENLPPDSVNYRFRLVGFDKDWVVPFKEGWYFYTDLAPGDYEFLAQSRRNGGEWGETMSHRFTIVTPWWRSIWAYILYTVTAAGIICYIWYLTRTKIRIHNQLLVERENQRFRNDFIIHASREFRTPLTIIRTTIEKLKGTNSERLSRTDIQHLRNSSRMLMEMVEQLVEFRESGKEIPYGSKGDVIEMADIPINKDLTVMIVESNKALADVIRREMLKYFKAEVSDGTEVLHRIEETCPDAVIIDTELTEANAYELLHSLKKNPETAQIPTILISDFDNSNSVLRAIRSGADDYLPKPFNCAVLSAIVMKNIKIKRENTVETEEQQAVTVTSPLFEKRADKLLLERIDSAIDRNLPDPEFDVNAIADSIGISRSQLYNKIKSLRGLSPVEYLRDRRLQEAARILRTEHITVKETRCMVGMPDATNFNRRFKEKFGTSPTLFR